MPEEGTDLFQQLWDFLSLLLFPDWVDLIALLPIVFLGLIALVLLYIARLWRRSSGRNRSRLPRRLATGSPPPGVHMPGPSRWPFVAPIGLTLLFFGLVLGNLLLLVAGLVVSVVAAVGWLREAMGEWRTTEMGHGAETLALAHGPAPLALEPGPRYGEPPPGVHMPGPSPWPFFAPIGLTLIFFGLILHPALVVGGLVLSVAAAIGWLREASREWHSTEREGHAVPHTRDPVRAWPRRMVPFAAAVVAISLVVAALPTVLGMLAPAAPTPPPVVVPEQPEITAHAPLSFDRSELVVPADRDFELVFHNEEAGVPHDVAITVAEPPADFLFDGEVITGPETITYQVPAIAEGDYYFYCTIHPTMNGTVLARPGTGEPAPADGAAQPPGTPAVP